MTASEKPTETLSVQDLFGFEAEMTINGFEARTDRVPLIDPTYKFDPETTLAILAGWGNACRQNSDISSQSPGKTQR